jgi:S-DNA-T family DNA segregation ATPase FtsK/SpoIIIE
VTGPVGCTLNDVRRSLLECAGLPEDAALRVGSRVLDAEAKWGLPPLLHGCLVVATGSDESAGSSRLGEQAGVLTADVVGGPDSGRRYPLRPGDHVVGRAGSATIRVLDPSVSRHHAVLTVTPEGLRISDLGSANGIDVEGVRVAAAGSPVRAGQRIHLGRSTFVVREPGARPAVTEVTGDGRLLVHRPPRRVGPAPPVVVRRPRKPQRPSRQRLSWLAMVVPLVVAVPLAALAHQPMFLLFSLLSPLGMLANALADRRGRRRDHRDAMRD